MAHGAGYGPPASQAFWSTASGVCFGWPKAIADPMTVPGCPLIFGPQVPVLQMMPSSRRRGAPLGGIARWREQTPQQSATRGVRRPNGCGRWVVTIGAAFSLTASAGADAAKQREPQQDGAHRAPLLELSTGAAHTRRVRRRKALRSAVAVGPLLGILATLAIAAGSGFRSKVVAVQDGDTLTIQNGDTQQRLRLEGIDCPERGQPIPASPGSGLSN